MGRQAGDALAALQQGVHRAERFLDDFLHIHETAPNALFGKLKDGGFGFAQDLFRGIALVGGARNRRIGGMHQSAQQRLVADNLNVVLNARPVGHAIEQAGDITRVPDRFSFFMAVQFLDQGDQVDGARGFGQVHHPRINTAMGVERKIVRLQTLRSLVVGEIVEQNRAQDGALGLDVSR